jgi:hypothetical protein
LPQPLNLSFATLAVAVIVAACVGGQSTDPGTASPVTFPTGSATATGSDSPTETPAGSRSPGDSQGGTPTPRLTAPPGTGSAACSGSDHNRAFFDQAATVMSWPVYCAVLPDGWFLEDGSYRLANGGHLQVTYRGPGGVHLALVQGNVCDDSDVETCAPRDAEIGPSDFGDRVGEMGRLGNGLVIDVDRGATPSWRATATGLTEEALRAIGAAFLVVEG